jgi:hypothetical protein
MAPMIYGTESLVGISLNLVTRLTLRDGPLHLSWKHSGMTSDFIADVMALPYAGSKSSHNQVHHDIGYLSNELIENAIKFRQPGAIIVEAGTSHGSFFMRVRNAIDSETSSRFKDLLHRIISRDPGELLLEQIETNAMSDTSGSGLGLLTLLSDYNAKMAWEFEDHYDQHMLLTTTAAVAIPPSSNP